MADEPIPADAMIELSPDELTILLSALHEAEAAVSKQPVTFDELFAECRAISEPDTSSPPRTPRDRIP